MLIKFLGTAKQQTQPLRQNWPGRVAGDLLEETNPKGHDVCFASTKEL